MEMRSHRGAHRTISRVTTVLPRKPWAVLVYLCGDTPELETPIEKNLTQIVAAGSSRELHVVVQRDHREGAKRFVVPEPGQPDPGIAREFRAVNTGDPAAFIDFLAWGLATCPSDRVA